jgi:ATP-dependent Clp protease ATP-binding subunit ClpC
MAPDDEGDDSQEAGPPLLERWTRDVGQLARTGQLRPALFRQTEINQAAAALKARRSVLLVGPAGVGKSCLVAALATALPPETGPLVSISTASLMRDTMYLGQWQTKVETLLEELRRKNAILYVADVWNLATAGTTVHDASTVLDAMKPHIETGHVRLIGEAVPEILSRMLVVPGFVALFQHVAVRALDGGVARQVVRAVADQSGEPFEDSALSSLVELTGRFSTQRPQPAPALELLDRVVAYRAEKRSIGEEEPLSDAFVEKVFSIYSGLPRFLISRSEVRSVRDIRGWFEERIVGQHEAVDAVVEMIALFKAGLHDPQRPLGTFLFVGPTGVGKTELARALATYLFGSPTRLVRIDMSELKDYNSFEMLVGDPKDRSQPARLLDPVRSQPFQVILLDEIEKAHPNVWDLLLQVLDDGRLTPPSGQPVDFRNTIIIATSNAGAEQGARALGFGAEGRGNERIRQGLEATFRPELLNRFGAIVVFHPLSREHVNHIARRELAKILQREGITTRNLLVEVDDDAMDLVIDQGFDPRWGARALKRELQRRVVLPLAVTLMERTTFAGTLLRVVRQGDDVRVRVVETETSRQARRAAEPAATPSGPRDRAALRAEARQSQEALAALARDIDEPALRAEQQRIAERRRAPELFADPAVAARTLRDLDRVTGQLLRLERLREHQQEIDGEAAAADTHDRLSRLAASLDRLRQALAAARRELTLLGSAGAWDAIVEIRPLGEHEGRRMRDLLVETYVGWARERGATVDVVFEPLVDSEPVMLTVSGPYAFGYLRLETGLHRLRDDMLRSVARVRVAAWTDAEKPASFGEQVALKAKGQLGGRVRSRVVVTEGLTLQNGRTLNENRELAGELLASWLAGPSDGETIVRRYDLSPWLVRDGLTEWQSGRSDALKPEAFHGLLCRRVEAAPR